MKCHEVKDKLLDYFDGEPTPKETAAIAAHLEECPECRAEADACRQAEAALKALGAEVVAPELRRDLRLRLEAAPRRRFVWQWAALGAAAAALLLFLVFGPATRPVSTERETAPITQNRPGAQFPPTEQPVAAKTPAPEDIVATPEIARNQPLVSVAEPYPRPAAIAATAQPDRAIPSDFALAAAVVVLPEPDATREYVETPEPEALVLVLGKPRAPAVSSTYIAEVTLPDGGRSRLGQVIKRDETGEVTEIHIACETLLPEDNDSQGG